MVKLFKIALIGDYQSCKEMREKYLGRPFQSKYMMTIGADFALKEGTFYNSAFKFQIWHLVEQPKFGAVRSVYYLSCLGAIIVYDVNNQKSFENIHLWIKEFWNHNGNGIMPFVIVGNNRDKHSNPEISTEVAIRYAEKLSEQTKSHNFSINFIEISTKTGQNINESLKGLVGAYLNFLEKDFHIEQNHILINKQKLSKEPKLTVENNNPLTIEVQPEPDKNEILVITDKFLETKQKIYSNTEIEEIQIAISTLSRLGFTENLEKSINEYSTKEMEINVIDVDLDTNIEKINYNNSHALIIGINDYSQIQKHRLRNLNYGIKDATGLVSVLLEKGILPNNIALLVDNKDHEHLSEYKSILRNNNVKIAFSSTIILELDKLSTITNINALFIYFAGHGIRKNGKDYLISFDGAISDDMDKTAISLTFLIEKMEKIKSRYKFLIIDACRSESSERGANFGTDLIEQKSEEKSIKILSCRPTEVSYECPSKNHGCFTFHLLENLAVTTLL